MNGTFCEGVEIMRGCESQQNDPKHSAEAVAQSIVDNFPTNLHHVLKAAEQLGLDHIVAWRPHGRCFAVKKVNEFVESILPLWCRQTKFSSFQRQLNIYGFKRFSNGLDKDCYYHKYFVRGKEELAKRIQRVKLKGARKGSRIQNEPEPNFYDERLYSPLPPLMGNLSGEFAPLSGSLLVRKLLGKLGINENNPAQLKFHGNNLALLSKASNDNGDGCRISSTIQDLKRTAKALTSLSCLPSIEEDCSSSSSFQALHSAQYHQSDILANVRNQIVAPLAVSLGTAPPFSHYSPLGASTSLRATELCQLNDTKPIPEPSHEPVTSYLHSNLQTLVDSEVIGSHSLLNRLSFVNSTNPLSLLNFSFNPDQHVLSLALHSQVLLSERLVQELVGFRRNPYSTTGSLQGLATEDANNAPSVDRFFI